jgi:hypothetical protein
MDISASSQKGLWGVAQFLPPGYVFERIYKKKENVLLCFV